MVRAVLDQARLISALSLAQGRRVGPHPRAASKLALPVCHIADVAQPPSAGATRKATPKGPLNPAVRFDTLVIAFSVSVLSSQTAR